MRRMYSKQQLEEVVDKKLEGYDAAIPTDLALGTDAKLHMMHDGIPIGDGIKFKTLFGNKSVFGTGNIDLYIHNIVLWRDDHSPYVINNAQFGVFLTIISSNNLVCDSLTHLNTLLGTGKKFIKATGNDDAHPIKALAWEGSFATSNFIYADNQDSAGPTTHWIYIRDDVETV